MEILAAIMGVISLLIVVLGFGLLMLGQKVGTWKRLTKSETAWHRKVADIGFNYIMPAGIMTSVTLLPLLILLGVVTFVVMLFVL